MKVTQSCQTLCNLMDYTVHGIFQARILEWAAFPFSRASSQTRNWTQVSRTAGGFFISWGTREAKQNKLVKGKTRQIISFKLKAKNVQCNQRLKRKKKKEILWLFETILVTDHQVPLSMEFPSKNAGVGCHFLLQGIFLAHGLNLGLLLGRSTA